MRHEMEKVIKEGFKELVSNKRNALELSQAKMAEAAAVADAVARAEAYCYKVLPAMSVLRETVDAMEPITASEYWHIPTYGDMMFNV